MNEVTLKQDELRGCYGRATDGAVIAEVQHEQHEQRRKRYVHRVSRCGRGGDRKRRRTSMCGREQGAGLGNPHGPGRLFVGREQRAGLADRAKAGRFCVRFSTGRGRQSAAMPRQSATSRTGQRLNQGGTQTAAYDPGGGRRRVPSEPHQHDHQQNTQLQIPETVGKPSDTVEGRLHNIEHGEGPINILYNTILPVILSRQLMAFYGFLCLERSNVFHS